MINQAMKLSISIRKCVRRVCQCTVLDYLILVGQRRLCTRFDHKDGRDHMVLTKWKVQRRRHRDFRDVGTGTRVHHPPCVARSPLDAVRPHF
jgi:hypothetical protein